MVGGTESQGTAVDNGDAGSQADNNPSGANEEKMKVVVRVRPFQAKEEAWPKTAADADVRGPDTIVSATITAQDNQVMWEKNGQLKILKADAVFANGATQDNVYHSVSECVDALIAGFDCSVFAYGQTGTGKTYTMSGLQHDEITNNNGLGLTPVNHGVVPRSIKRLFAEIEREKRGAAGSSFSVYCSFIEIYNEKIYDILSPEVPTNGKGNQSPDTKTTAATTGSLTQRARWNSTVSGRTAFIVTISPSKGSLEESFATLRFAERLKAIRCRPIRRSLFSNEMLGEQRLYYERQIQAMRAEVNRLRELLRKANQRPSEPAGSSSRDANAALVEENRRLKELLLQSERSRIVERNERITNKSGKTNVSGSVRMSPQQFSARQMLKPTSIQDEESSISANQLTTLENQLQSKEARLNWMLEAEMEAQNAGTGTPIAKDAVSADPNRT
ncbi:kinesin-like protein [Phytophthora cinnamomi]|uniref:kinesin-like protein n=1 Tax=Phytophthora cinnamomi TaxID=4785 RepID=UPI003559C0E6|nr:kinesin-like protein [Phytophthora cinnamomi]